MLVVDFCSQFRGVHRTRVKLLIGFIICRPEFMGALYCIAGESLEPRNWTEMSICIDGPKNKRNELSERTGMSQVS